MTSFSPDRARSWSWGMVTRMGTRILTPVEGLAPCAHGLDPVHEGVEIRALVDEVEPLTASNQQRAFGVVEEKPRVGLRNAAQIVLVDAVLAALADAIDERIDRGLQVHDKIRRRRLRLHVLVDAAVELELGVVQREAREERVLREREVG